MFTRVHGVFISGNGLIRRGSGRIREWVLDWVPEVTSEIEVFARKL